MIDRLRPPANGRMELADELCPGVVLRVTDQGTKTLSVNYRVSGEGS